MARPRTQRRKETKGRRPAAPEQEDVSSSKEQAQATLPTSGEELGNELMPSRHGSTRGVCCARLCDGVTNRVVLTAVVAWAFAPVQLPFDNTLNALTFLSSAADAGLDRHAHVVRDVELSLQSLVGVPSDRYVVLSGARGSGKTQAVLSAADGACGVLRIRVANDKAELSSEFMKRMLRAGSPATATVDGVQLILRRAAWFMSWTCCAQTVPTLIVEVESGTRGDVVYNLFHEIKVLSSDSKVCRAITVLSDATTVYSLPADGDRQLEVFVDDLTEAEARQMLAKRGVANETRRTALIKAVGTRASSLAAVVDLQDDAEALRAYVAEREEKAYQQLGVLLDDATAGDGLEMYDALVALYRTIAESDDRPRQVRTAALVGGITDSFKKPQSLAKLMKAREAHVLLYHPAEDAYRFLTVFHERAVARVLAEAAA